MTRCQLNTDRAAVLIIAIPLKKRWLLNLLIQPGVRKSVMSIYINPENPGLAMSLGMPQKHLYSASLHLCQKTYLHFVSDYHKERVKVKKKPSVHTQVTNLVKRVLKPAYNDFKQS